MSKTPARIRIEAGFHSIEAMVRDTKGKMDIGAVSRYESGKLNVIQEDTLINWKRIALTCGVRFEVYRAAVLDQRERVLKK